MFTFRYCYFKRNNYFGKPSSFPPAVEEIHSGFDWDLWQGPAAERPFSNYYAPRRWRGFLDYGSGMLGDWGCHTFDAPFWALDLGMPHWVGAELLNPIADHSFVSDESTVTWNFKARGKKAPVKMKWIEGGKKPAVRPEWGIAELPENGMIMIGEKKTLITDGRPNTPKLLVPDKEWKAFLKNPPPQTIARVEEEKPVKEWLDAIKNNLKNIDVKLPKGSFIKIPIYLCQFDKNGSKCSVIKDGGDDPDVTHGAEIIVDLSFTDKINEIEIDGKVQLLYPHQLVVVARSSLQVKVFNSFFRGNTYLIEARHAKGNLFFESDNDATKYILKIDLVLHNWAPGFPNKVLASNHVIF